MKNNNKETYIALLRGINVSGQKKIKMTDLKNILLELEFENIQTYIQSGNIVFKYSRTSLKDLETQIENKIFEHYNFKVPTMVKNPSDLEHILHNNPFLNDPNKDQSRLYVTFLAEIPSRAHTEKLKSFDYRPEEYIIDGKTIYFYSPHGYGRAKMNNNFFENQLKVAATTRNWKTINKLVELAGS